jgi:hypothetical protein
MKISYLIFLLVGVHFGAFSQSLTGTNGLFKIPSAYVLEDGLAYVGASFYPKGSYNYLNAGDTYSGMPTFITLSLYDRVEFMFRYTHQLGHDVSPLTEYFPDRMFSLRYNLVKESPNVPSVVLGFHDVSEAIGVTSAVPWFLATYLVASKRLESRYIEVIPTIGYGYDFFGQNRDQIFDGLFGGLELRVNSIRNIGAIMEYDTKGLNFALKFTLFDHFHSSIGLLNGNSLSGFFTYRFNLSN